MNFYKYTVYNNKDLEQEFISSINNGLTDEQLIISKNKYGFNTIDQKNINWIYILLRQFKSAFIYLLIGCALLSFILGDKINSLIIILIVIINSLLSFIQEYRAEQALQKLKLYLKTEATVLRNNIKIIVDSKDLVPGDIIYLQTGSYIPADVRFISSDNLSVDESTLTGESVTTKKISNALNEQAKDIYTAQNFGFLGTTVSTGSAKAIVIATGRNTNFGSISELTLQTERQSSFQKRITKLSKFILYVILTTLTVIFTFHLIVKGTSSNILELLMFCIALTLGLTPEALPTVVTFALSKGALILAKNNVIVKRLSAIEDLGSVNILCTDKTGTLTQNSLSIIDCYNNNDKNLMVYAALTSFTSDPFDKAILNKISNKENKEIHTYKKIKEFPFEPSKLRNSALVEYNNNITLIVRGAYEKIKTLCQPFDKEIRENIENWINTQENNGNRILAVAYKKLDNIKVPDISDKEEHNLIFAGAIAFHDPIKPTAKKAILKARALGIEVKIITGDSKKVSCSVARQIGLMSQSEDAITGAELELLSPELRQKAIVNYKVFARISPTQKYMIIDILQKQEDVTVAFLGEGINDAPALKISDVGLAVSNSSDIARDSADVILMNESLLTIIQGIAIGRTVFANTIKYIITTLASSFGNFYSVAIASLFIDFLPMLPIQILLLNLMSDAPMISIATDAVDPDQVKMPPTYNLRSIAFITTVLGIVSSIFDFIIFALFYKVGPKVLQTNWFIASILTEIALIFSTRTRKVFLRAQRPSKLLIILATLSALSAVILPLTYLGQVFFSFTAPTTRDLIIIFIVTCVYFVTTEIVKLLYYRWTGNNNHNISPLKRA